MKHILLECDAPGRKKIWELAERLWQGKRLPWPTLRLGTILGSPLANFKDANKRARPGATRLYKILMTELAHLIWVLRCERVCGDRFEEDEEPGHSIKEIEACWRKAINQRLCIDCEIARKKHGGTREKATKKVLNTWRGVLQDEHLLPENWIYYRQVLVSRGHSKRLPRPGNRDDG